MGVLLLTSEVFKTGDCSEFCLYGQYWLGSGHAATGEEEFCSCGTGGRYFFQDGI